MINTHPVLAKLVSAVKASLFDLPCVLPFLFFGYLRERYVGDVEDSFVLIRVYFSNFLFIIKEEGKPALELNHG